jgi:hypothetical protein
LQQLRSPTFDIRDIFGASRFSTFSTVSVKNRLPDPHDYAVPAGHWR